MNDPEFFYFSLVSKVTVTGDTTTGEYGSSLNITCTVTGNDTFDAWKSPSGIDNTSEFISKRVGNNTYNLNIIKLSSNDNGTWVCRSREGNNDTITVIVLGRFTWFKNLISSNTTAKFNLFCVIVSRPLFK